MTLRSIVGATLAFTLVVVSAGQNCFALTDDAAGARACCLQQGHDDDCANSRLAESCCKGHEANRHDREISSVFAKVMPHFLAIAGPIGFSSDLTVMVPRHRSTGPLSFAANAPPGYSLPLLI